MEFVSVLSSNIQGINYDKVAQVLTVEFKSGSRYAYRGVPEEVYDDFLEAGSKGSFFANSIKDSYPYTRV